MSYSTSAIEDDVIFENINSAKVITLNRPQKLNSLNESMIDKLYPRLLEYSKSQLTDIIIQKSNGRAFCAGGDVAACLTANEQGKPEESVRYFQKEYSLNYLYAAYPKPVVSLMNGIIMGGGVGLTIHTPFRIATENTRWAMPEMDIGFFPDVGATFALNRVVPSSLGWYLALTGENVFGWDAYFSGLATHYVPSHRLPELIKALSTVSLHNTDSFTVVNGVIEDFTESLPQGYKFKYTTEQVQLIEKVFKPSSTIRMIFEALEADGSEFALIALETLKKKSPLSLTASLELLERGAHANIHEALTSELSAAKQFMINSDFNEGVSSKLIRKSKEVPSWKHKSVSEVNVTKEALPLLKNDPKLKLNNHFNVTFTEYPHNYGLPKESEIQAFIEGSGSKTNGSVAKKDVIDHFTQHSQYKNKAGLAEYLRSVLSSKVTDEDQTLKWKL
jgi:3-hydroxyisobutyryl-CoA hydrolase